MRRRDGAELRSHLQFMQLSQTSQVQLNHVEILIDQHCKSSLDAAIEVPDPTRVGSLLLLLAMAVSGPRASSGSSPTKPATPRSRPRKPAKPAGA